jgi:hypothetical protein
MWWAYSILGIIFIFGIVVFRGAPYVPSHRRFVRQAFDKLYKISSKDVLVDIGSGDGIILREAAARGAKAVGYEINPILVLISRLLARGNPRITTKLVDLWLTDIPADTTIVYAFAVSRDIEKVARKIQQSADTLDRPLWLMTYGAGVSSRTPIRSLKAHNLYRFEPLHSKKA